MTPMSSGRPPVFTMLQASRSEQDLKASGDLWTSCVLFCDFQLPEGLAKYGIYIVTSIYGEPM